MVWEGFNPFEFFVDSSDIESGSARVELAETDLAELRTPIERPGPEDFRDPKAYLQYLESRMSSTLRVLETPGTVEAPQAMFQSYRDALDEIQKELNRFGGPRSSELEDLYQTAQSTRSAFGIA